MTTANEVLMDARARREQMRRLVIANVPLAEIGQRFGGISPQRVRQIVTDNGRDKVWFATVRLAQQSLLVNKAATLWKRMAKPRLMAVATKMDLSVERTRRLLVMAGIDVSTRPLPAHGTRSRYIHYGCRCEPCRKDHAAYHRKYSRARRKEQP